MISLNQFKDMYHFLYDVGDSPTSKIKLRHHTYIWCEYDNGLPYEFVFMSKAVQTWRIAATSKNGKIIHWSMVVKHLWDGEVTIEVGNVNEIYQDLILFKIKYS